MLSALRTACVPATESKAMLRGGYIASSAVSSPSRTRECNAAATRRGTASAHGSPGQSGISSRSVPPSVQSLHAASSTRAVNGEPALSHQAICCSHAAASSLFTCKRAYDGMDAVLQQRMQRIALASIASAAREAGSAKESYELLES